MNRDCGRKVQEIDLDMFSGHKEKPSQKLMSNSHLIFYVTFVHPVTLHCLEHQGVHLQENGLTDAGVEA